MNDYYFVVVFLYSHDIIVQKSFCFSSPLRCLVTPAAKNLLPLFDGLSWKTLEKRPKFPHMTEGDLNHKCV